MAVSDIQRFTNFINQKVPCIYVKYGDGEYLASVGGKGLQQNCDKTPYTSKLQEAMNESFIYLSKQNNAYLGQYNGETFNHWNNFTNLEKKWASYHLFIFYGSNTFNQEKKDLYKAIKYSKCQKIFICNEDLYKNSKQLLNIDTHIIIDKHNWFENDFNTIVNNTIRSIRNPNNFIILTSAGMGAKPLISTIHKKFPNGIFLDVGSAIDYICTGKPSRAHHYTAHTYNDLNTFFSSI